MTTPKDIDPESGMRLPRPRREDLDDIGKQSYDRATKPGATIMGLHGPAGIQLYSRGSPSLNAHNKYLRFEAGLHHAGARGRDPGDRPRVRQPVRMGGA